MRQPGTYQQHRGRCWSAIAITVLVVLATAVMPTATTSAAQPVATATPAIARAAAPDASKTSGDDDPPLLGRVPAWQVTGGILLAAVLATIVLYLTVRFRGRASS